MATSFYSKKELDEIGFNKFGKNVLISRNVKIYGASEMIVGNNVRIDDFCVLSGKIELGNNIHVAVYNALFGGSTGICLRDFVGLSSRCAIYAESDDYSGEHLTNPTVDEEYLGIVSGRVELKKHVIVGTGVTILPGVTIGEGSAVGSMSLVNKSLGAWGIYAGTPCVYRKERSKKLLDLEKKYLGDR